MINYIMVEIQDTEFMKNTEETIMQKKLAIYYLNWQKNMDYNI